MGDFTLPPGVDPGSIVLPGQKPPPPSKLDMTQFNQRKQQAAPVEHALGGIMNLIMRPGESLIHAQQTGNWGSPVGWHEGLSNLLHGNITPQQYQQETDTLIERRHHWTPEQFAAQPAVKRAAMEFTTQMVNDPLTAIGQSGLGRAITEEAGLRWLPAAMSAGAKLGERAAGTAFQDAMDLLGRTGGWLHDSMTPGGKPVAHAIRELAAKQGAEGMKQAERMMSSASGSRSTAGYFGAVGKQVMDQTLHGVHPADQSLIFKAIHHGTISKLPESLRPVADRLVNADRSILWLMGTKTVRKWLSDRGFSLPQEFRPFDKGPRGLVSMQNVRENHVPMPHELDDEERQAAFANLNRKPGARAMTDTRNRFFKQRTKEPPAGWETDPDAVRETWEASFRTAGRQLGAADLRTNLVKLFSTPPKDGEEFLKVLGDRMNRGDLSTKPLTIKGLAKMAGLEDEPVATFTKTITKAVERPTATAVLKRRVPRSIRDAFGPREEEKLPDWLQVPMEIGKHFQNAQNIWKGSLFYTPTGHQKNIATLLALANPSTFPTALANYFRTGLGFASPAKRMKVFSDSIAAGAVPFSNVEQTGLTNIFKHLGWDKGDLGALGKAVNKWYGGSGKMLWGWDSAVKDALYKSELEHFGGDSLRAAAAVRRKLVDYEQSTGFQELVRSVAPFATWRTAMPQAVLTSLAEHPEYGLGLNRATGGAIAGQPFSMGGQEYQATTPLSETNELTTPGERHKYVRSAISPPMRLAANAAAKALGMSQVPYSKAMLESSLPGANPFGDTREQQALFTLLGIHPYKEPKWHRYSHKRRKWKEPEGNWLGLPLP